jgi:hypothetical protein
VSDVGIGFIANEVRNFIASRIVAGCAAPGSRLAKSRRSPPQAGISRFRLGVEIQHVLQIL